MTDVLMYLVYLKDKTEAEREQDKYEENQRKLRR